LILKEGKFNWIIFKVTNLQVYFILCYDVFRCGDDVLNNEMMGAMSIRISQYERSDGSQTILNNFIYSIYQYAVRFHSLFITSI